MVGIITSVVHRTALTLCVSFFARLAAVLEVGKDAAKALKRDC